MLGIDEHSFRHQELVHTVAEVKKRKVKIPKKIFLIGREKLSEEKRQRVDELLDSIIFNLKLADDAELMRSGNTLKRWREPILNHFNTHTTNGFTEGCNTKIKILKRISYGIRNVEVY